MNHFDICKLFFFDYVILESVLLFLHIGEPSNATSKMSIQRSAVGKLRLRHSNCNVRCDDISDVWYVLSVPVCVH